MSVDALVVDGLRHQYGQRTALAGVSFSVGRGELFKDAAGGGLHPPGVVAAEFVGHGQPGGGLDPVVLLHVETDDVRRFRHDVWSQRAAPVGLSRRRTPEM